MGWGKGVYELGRERGRKDRGGEGVLGEMERGREGEGWIMGLFIYISIVGIEEERERGLTAC